MAKDMPWSITASAWFLRAASLVVVVCWVLRIMHSGWSKDFRSFGSATGIIGAAMLCLLSFTLTTTGRAKTVFAIGTIILALCVVLLATAGLIFPRP